MLGQSSAVTFKNLFRKSHRSTCFNKKCFLFNECKREHRKDSKPAIYGCLLSAPTPIASGCPHLDYPSPQTYASSHLHPSDGAYKPWRLLSQKELFPQWFFYFSKPLLFATAVLHQKGRWKPPHKPLSLQRHRSTTCHHSGLCLLNQTSPSESRPLVSPFIFTKIPPGPLRELAVISRRWSACEEVLRKDRQFFFS